MTASLFSEFTINEFTFKNRLGVAPMTRMSASDNSIPRQDVLDFLVTRAKMMRALSIPRPLSPIMRVPRGIRGRPGY